MYTMLLAVFLFTAVRLYIVTDAGNASQVLAGQYSRKITIAERRGFIFDRNGKLLNMKKTGYVCVVIPERSTDPKNDAQALAAASNYTQAEIYDKIIRGIPFLLDCKRSCTSEAVFSYPKYKECTVCAPHIVGYTDSSGRGAAGIQKYYNDILTNVFGADVVLRYTADASGVPFGENVYDISDSGYKDNDGIYLSIDKELQRYCEKLVDPLSCSGAICVMDISSGELLACVSYPDFDTEKVYNYLDSDKGELVNRCLSGTTPGSVFKTVVAASALEADPEMFGYEYTCTGAYTTVDGDIIPCHKKDGHGLVTMREAYAQSCNPYFIDLASYVGEDRILSTAQSMGVRLDTDIDGMFACTGIIPRYDEKLSSHSGYIANLAIGQGKTLISPIQACSIFACAASGVYRTPTLLADVPYDDSEKDSVEGERVLDDKTTELLCEMMLSCVEEGLGKEAAPKKVTAGGKTATAQTGMLKDGKEILNCWFGGVFPADAPRYSVCILVSDTENSGIAKVLFRKICDFQINNEKNT